MTDGDKYAEILKQLNQLNSRDYVEQNSIKLLNKDIERLEERIQDLKEAKEKHYLTKHRALKWAASGIVVTISLAIAIMKLPFLN